MEKISFYLGLVLCIFLTSCFGDDDDGQPNTSNINLIGTWEVQEISNVDFSNLGCEGVGRTTIEFKENNKLVISNLEVSFFDSEGNLGKPSCQIVSNEDGSESTELQGDYIPNDNIGTILFDGSTPELDGTDDFIPPPMDIFNYKIEENILFLTTSNPNINPTIQYRFEKKS